MSKVDSSDVQVAARLAHRRTASQKLIALGTFLTLFGVLPRYLKAVSLPQCQTASGTRRPADVYVPLDNWAYPALDRLHGLGYLDTGFLGLRPWTRRSIQRMVADSAQDNGIQKNSQAVEILAALQREFGNEDDDGNGQFSYACEGLYTRVQGIGGLTLRDSYHLGQTIANDYGRPYQPGFNTVNGVSGSAEYGRFSLYARGEYQHAPSSAGYSAPLVATLSNLDTAGLSTGPVLTTLPAGPVAASNTFRIIEANLSYRVLNHEISFGKSDHWFAPTVGGAFTYSNNAENIYAFQIDRTEPLYVPWLSRLVGPFRYDFFVGSLKGHSSPNDPWMHIEKINFKPTSNLEFGFERSVIWGGEGHVPITVHTFLRSFFSVANVTPAQKFSRDDPGARFSSFDFSWRLPWLKHWATLYSDAMAHDDVNPVDAPRHASVRPGVYLSRLPGLQRVDLRMEGVNTDPKSWRSVNGRYMYWEGVQVQGYTNKSLLMGDAIGRQGKGGQAWLTYHLSPSELIQTSYRHSKADNSFIPGGTTQNSFDVHVVKRLGKDIELSADVQREWWKVPLYQMGQRGDTVATFQLTIYPQPGVTPRKTP
ncbi:MAG TPA: capsule assembly Wzi family protein [Acidobacteriaceae bacterium]|nr:capsule assembly Wzi family protein [Acidobacteriaceae bacterium]